MHNLYNVTCEYPWTYESDCLTQWCPNNCRSSTMLYNEI